MLCCKTIGLQRVLRAPCLAMNPLSDHWAATAMLQITHQQHHQQQQHKHEQQRTNSTSNTTQLKAFWGSDCHMIRLHHPDGDYKNQAGPHSLPCWGEKTICNLPHSCRANVIPITHTASLTLHHSHCITEPRDTSQPGAKALSARSCLPAVCTHPLQK